MPIRALFKEDSFNDSAKAGPLQLAVSDHNYSPLQPSSAGQKLDEKAMNFKLRRDSYLYDDNEPDSASTTPYFHRNPTSYKHRTAQSNANSFQNLSSSEHGGIPH